MFIVREEAFTPRFSELAHELAAAARGLGLTAPAFASPPRRPDAERVVRWWPGRRGATVAVRRDGRPLGAVAADMVEGVIVVNGLGGEAAARARRALAAAVPAAIGLPAARGEREQPGGYGASSSSRAATAA